MTTASEPSPRAVRRGPQADIGPLTVPRRLTPGDLIAVATPSGPVHTPRRFARGARTLRSLGFEVVTGPMAAPSNPRDRRSRADELNTFLRDPSVRAIVMSIGGYTSSAVLGEIDWQALRDDPKIILGYSDITAILLAALVNANVVTFHGPTLMAELGEYPEILPYTCSGILRALTEPKPLGVLHAARKWTEEFLPWDEADNRARTMRKSSGWKWLSPGEAVGRLLGGNLDTICSLAGTRFMPDFRGAIVLIETASSTLDSIERCMTHLEMLGVFDQMAGMLVGRTFRGNEELEAGLRQLICEYAGSRAIPVVSDMDIGHTDPMLTLPLGVRVHLNSSTRQVEVLDAAVR